MANWGNLKSAVSAAIKENGNGEITGQVLQNTLNSIITAVGKNATFAGIATPTTSPGSPDGPVFYIAAQPGVYANFNGIKVTNQAKILYNNGNQWSSANTEIVLYGNSFSGDVSINPEADNYIDKILTSGLYIKKSSSADAAQYILHVKEYSSGYVYQMRIYLSDSNKPNIGIRSYDKSNNTWSPWTTKIIAFDDGRLFDGFIDTRNPEADNYIDKVISTGIYKRVKGDYPIIYFVKRIGPVTYQTQLYYSDGGKLVFRVRSLTDGVWTEWSNDTFAYNVNTFKFSDVDNILSYGTYISSETYNSGLLSVMKSELSEYNVTQVVIMNDVNSGKLKKGTRHHKQNGVWLDWGWEYIDDDTLQTQIAKNGIEFDLSSYVQYKGYISQNDLSVNSHDGYRTISIPLSDIPDGQKFLTVPCQGAAILLVGYWKGDYTISSNYLGRDKITAFNNAGDRMYTSIPLSNLIPNEATHMTLCWNNIALPKLVIFNPDLNCANINRPVLPSMYLGQRDVIYGGIENALLYKRGALLNIVGEHSDLIIVAGQSNAEGMAAKSEAPQWLIDINYKMDNYMMWNPIKKQFQSWELGVNTGSEDNARDKFGFDIYFAKKYLEANPGKKLYAIKQSVGGTPISPLRANGESRKYCWTPMPELITDGGISMCNQLIEKIKNAYQYALKNNINLALQVLLWHQGEADMASVRAPYFEDNLKGLLSWMRGIWNAPALPIINGQISSYYDTQWQPTYSANKVFSALNAIDPYFKTVNMNGQPMQSDNVHFTAGGYEHMGYEMWNYYLEFNPVYEPVNSTLLSLNTFKSIDIPTD